MASSSPTPSNKPTKERLNPSRAWAARGCRPSAYAVLPQVMPSFVANLFYAFDYNLRAAIPLGVFGGGGIGFELAFANGLLHYKDVLAYTILIVVMINGMERISDWVRRGIITQPQLLSQNDGIKEEREIRTRA